MKVVPRPTRLRTRIVPPWLSGIELVRDLHAALAEPLGDEAGGLFDERVEIHLAHGFLLPIEAEHLPEDARHPLRFARGDVEVRALGSVPSELLLQQVQG